MKSGILNINKPTNISSFQVVAIVRRLTKVKKVGHLGTLDPLASGVLPVAVGKATKLFDYFLTKRKTYRAIFCFGKETDTLDSEGEIIKTSNTIVSINDVKAATEKFVGKICQTPPKYSSKNINGVRAYNLARNNVDFDLAPVNVEVFKFDVIEEITQNQFLFEIECSAGCYIRSLCRDLAYSMNTVGYMSLLIRTSAGQFNINDSIDLKTLKESNNIEDYIIPIENVLPFEKVYLNDLQSKKIKNGMTVDIDLVNNNYLLFDKNEFFALGKVCNKILKMEIYFGD